MNISHTAELTGLPPKTIRYYEDIGLVHPDRSMNGYRDFSQSDVHKLAFLGRARGLGFSIEQCRDLLALWEDTDRASGDVRRIARGHLDEIERKIAGLVEMRDSLSNLIACCSGDDRPDCPILESLAGSSEGAGQSKRQ